MHVRCLSFCSFRCNFCFDAGAAVGFFPDLSKLITILPHRLHVDLIQMQTCSRLTPPFCCFVVVFEDGGWRGRRSVIRAESIWTVFTLKQGFAKNCIHCFSIKNLVQTSLTKFSLAVLIKRTWISVRASGEVGEWWRCVLAGSSGKRTAVALLLHLSLKWL